VRGQQLRGKSRTTWPCVNGGPACAAAGCKPAPCARPYRSPALGPNSHVLFCTAQGDVISLTAKAGRSFCTYSQAFQSQRVCMLRSGTHQCITQQKVVGMSNCTRNNCATVLKHSQRSWTSRLRLIVNSVGNLHSR
jgi:hypothetical protein